MRISTVGAILLLLWAGWAYAIPRTEVRVETVYHHSYSGNFIQCRVTNEGTLAFSGLEIELSVWNDTLLVEQQSWRPGALAAHQSVKLPSLVYHEPSAFDYHLLLTIRFSDGNGPHELRWAYEISEYGNLAWSETYRQV